MPLTEGAPLEADPNHEHTTAPGAETPVSRSAGPTSLAKAMDVTELQRKWGSREGQCRISHACRGFLTLTRVSRALASRGRREHCVGARSSAECRFRPDATADGRDLVVARWPVVAFRLEDERLDGKPPPCGNFVVPGHVAADEPESRFRPAARTATRRFQLTMRCGLSVSWTRSRCASVNSSAIDGSTSTTATPKTISTLVSVALGAAASSIVRVLRQQVRVLRDAPAPDHGGDRADGERARAAHGAARGAGRARRRRRRSDRITSGRPSLVRPS